MISTTGFTAQKKRLRKQVWFLKERLRLLRRWLHSDARVDTDSAGRQLHGLNRCDILYINLDERSDRRAEIKSELLKLGAFQARRLSATRDSNPALGCGYSHLAALESWRPSKDRLLLILEDDCVFLEGREVLDDIIERFATDRRLEVLALANNTRWSLPVNRTFAVSEDIQTTAAYAAKASAVPDLIASMKESINRMQNGGSPRDATIDKVWKAVQRGRFFAIPRRSIAVQRPGFSDIQLRWVDYQV